MTGTAPDEAYIFGYVALLFAIYIAVLVCWYALG